MNNKQDRNLWLDIIRGLSALIVCFGHLRNALLVDFGTLANPSIATKIFYTLTGFGHQSVMVFFVLSGYFVGGGVLRAGSKFTWVNYLSSRLTRLWVVLLPCLLLTWGIDHMINIYNPGALAGVSFDNWHSGPKPGEYSTSLSTFFGNIIFLQTIELPVFGTNGPLWSLANEFWYYILFPAIVLIFGLAGSGSFSTRITALAIGALASWWLPRDVLYGFIIWMMGVVIYLLEAWFRSLKLNLIRFITGLSFSTFIASLAYSKSTSLIEYANINPDILIGITFSAVCLSLTYRPFPSKKYPIFERVFRHLSEMSYSLYISHFPVVILISTIFYSSNKLVLSGLALVQFMGWSIVLIGVGYMVYWFFEARTVLVRTSLLRLNNAL